VNSEAKKHSTKTTPCNQETTSKSIPRTWCWKKRWQDFQIFWNRIHYRIRTRDLLTNILDASTLTSSINTEYHLFVGTFLIYKIQNIQNLSMQFFDMIITTFDPSRVLRFYVVKINLPYNPEIRWIFQVIQMYVFLTNFNSNSWTIWSHGSKAEAMLTLMLDESGSIPYVDPWMTCVCLAKLRCLVFSATNSISFCFRHIKVLTSRHRY
jgi:hypothetical protein